MPCFAYSLSILCTCAVSFPAVPCPYYSTQYEFMIARLVTDTSGVRVDCGLDAFSYHCSSMRSTISCDLRPSRFSDLLSCSVNSCKHLHTTISHAAMYVQPKFCFPFKFQVELGVNLLISMTPRRS